MKISDKLGPEEQLDHSVQHDRAEYAREQDCILKFGPAPRLVLGDPWFDEFSFVHWIIDQRI